MFRSSLPSLSWRLCSLWVTKPQQKSRPTEQPMVDGHGLSKETRRPSTALRGTRQRSDQLRWLTESPSGWPSLVMYSLHLQIKLWQREVEVTQTMQRLVSLTQLECRSSLTMWVALTELFARRAEPSRCPSRSRSQTPRFLLLELVAVAR